MPLSKWERRRSWLRTAVARDRRPLKVSHFPSACSTKMKQSVCSPPSVKEGRCRCRSARLFTRPHLGWSRTGSESVGWLLSSRRCRLALSEKLFDTLDVGRDVHPDAFVIDGDNGYGNAVVQSTQLFELFGCFQR